MGIKASWKTIRDWLEANYPSLLERLGEPASDADLDALEERIEQKLPKGFRELYRIHDGCEEDVGLFGGLGWMSLEQVGDVWETWADLAEDEDLLEDLNDDYSSHPDEAVVCAYAHRGWVPIVGDSQHHFAIDYDPGPKGKVGQIINCGRDDEIRHVVADTFEGFFEWVADQFRQERICLADGEDEEDPDWLGLKPGHLDPATGEWVAGSGRKRDLLTGLRCLLGLDRCE